MFDVLYHYIAGMTGKGNSRADMIFKVRSRGAYIIEFSRNKQAAYTCKMSERKQDFCYRKVTLYKSQTLGTGSYGIVCKAKCDQLLCAAKIMHNALFKFSDPSTNLLLSKFKQECLLNSAAKHPNIVQYIHTYVDPESNLPVLLMELCDESLTTFLERKEKTLPYHLELDLSNDIAQALSYLHSNGVIHRDLTSNNVLLIAESRAKVTDFGMSKLVSVNPRFTPLSMCPGNALYMSPEALRQPPQYSTKLDCFSWGVLAIQIMTRLFPDPGPQFNTREESDGRIIHEVIPEDRRRQSHIDIVDPAHLLLSLAIKCLHYNEKTRPSADSLCQEMALLCQTQRYTQSKQKPKTTHSQQLNGQLQLKREHEDLKDDMQKMSRELGAKDREIRSVNARIARMKQEIDASEKHSEAADQTLKVRDETITLLQQNIEQQQDIISTLRAKMDDNEDTEIPSPQHSPMTTNIPLVPPRSKLSLISHHNPPDEGEQKNVPRSRAAQVRDARLQRSSPGRGECGRGEYGRGECGRGDYILAKAEEKAREMVKEKVMKINVRKGEKAPDKMARGSAAVYGSTAYFACFSSSRIHYYQCLMGRDKWGTLPKGPYVNFSLTIVNGFPTTIGGCKSVGSDQPTNTLLSLISEGSKKKWVESVPPMPTQRQESAAISTEHFIVVVGGRGVGGERLNTVEVFKHDNKQWHVAGCLPLPLIRPTASICGDEIFIGSGSPAHGIVSKSVYCSTISTLLSPYYTFPASAPRSASGRQHSAWREIASIQADHFTLCTLSHRLVAVGGVEMSHCNSSAVRKYDSDKNIWEVVGHINHGRCLALATALGGDTMLVVGGMMAGKEGNTNILEVAQVCYL